MKKTLLAAAVILFVIAPPPSSPTARIRLAGVFLQGFGIWHSEAQNCAIPASKPWMTFDCGFFKCPKTRLLGIPPSSTTRTGARIRA